MSRLGPSRADSESTAAGSGRQTTMSSRRPRNDVASWLAGPAEVLGCVLFFMIYAGGAVPQVNEAHYLAKARHYWNPQWCAGDSFLESADAHTGFYLAVGWLTKWLSMPAAAWLVRLVTWTLLALGWRRLVRSLGLGLGWTLFTSAAAVVLVKHLHLAGEWFVGGIEGKSLAYPFVFSGMAAVIEQQWGRFWLRQSLATLFHPVVGGWSLLAGLFAGFWDHRSARFPASPVAACDINMSLGDPGPSGPAKVGIRERWTNGSIRAAALLAGALALSIAVGPALQLTRGASPTARRQADEIQVYERLPHHLVPHLMARAYQWRFGGLTLLWVAVALATWQSARPRRMHLMVALSVIVLLAGVGIDLVTRQRTDLGAWLLKFYWFRLADVFVPTGLVLGSVLLGYSRPRWLGELALGLALVAIMVSTAVQFQENRRDRRPAADRQGSFGMTGDLAEKQARYRDWRELTEWARESTDEASLFLTPTRSQTFKWYAERPEYVTWKDFPQDATSILSWHERIGRIADLGLYRPGPRPDAVSVGAFAASQGIDYVVVLRELDRDVWPFPLVFRNDTFDVYRIDKDGRSSRRDGGEAHQASRNIVSRIDSPG